MARTLTITDDALGATASVRIEDQDGQPVVRALTFEALQGRGLTADALSLIEALGLRLPQSPAPAKAVPAKAVPAKAVPAKAKAKAKAAPAPAPARAKAKAPARAAGRTVPEPRTPQSATLPVDAGPDAVPAQPALPAPAALPAPPAPAARARTRRTRRVGPPPTAEELQASFRTHGGVASAMAADLGAAPSSVHQWLRRAREAGAQFTLDATEPAAGSRP